MTDDLTAFLRARLDEDEQAALAATDTASGHWFVGDKWNVYDEADTAPYDDAESNPLITYGDMLSRSEHIARHDPARVLAEVDAKRRIIELYAYWEDLAERSGIASLSNFARGDRYGLMKAARLLALPYREHPDYRPEWAPEA